MIRVGGDPLGNPGEDVQFCGLFYPDGDSITRHMEERLFAEPFYQHDKLKDALSFVKQWRGAIDCGAWVGAWSRELAKHFSTVLAIEANLDNARCVARNTPTNVVVLHAAVSDRNGTAIAYAEAGGPNVGTRVVAIGDAETSAKVATTRIDDMPRVQAMAFIDYIKIHVNGMELKALRGARETILRHKPAITIVLKPALATYGHAADEARTMLRDGLGYRPGGGERPYEIWVPR